MAPPKTPGNDHEGPRAAAMREGRSLLACLACLACAACSNEAPSRLPTPSAAEVVVTRDDKVAYQASAYVELHLWLTELATHPELHAPPALEAARSAYADSLRDVVTDSLARRTTGALSACDSLTCARAALAAARMDKGFDAALPWFLERAWPRILARTDKARARLRASLPQSMPHLVAELARTLDAPPPELVRLDVVHASARFRDSPYAPLALEDSQPCLRGRGEDKPAALACALFQAALGMRQDSRLYRRLDEALGHDDAGRVRAHYIYTLVAAHAVRIVARAVSGEAREPFTRGLLEREPEAEAFLARRFAERASDTFLRELDRAVSR